MSFIERFITKSNPRALNWVLAIVILGIIALMWFSYSSSIGSSSDAGGVTITYRAFPFMPKNNIHINCADIESAQVFDRAPAMHKTWGFAIGRIKAGNFTATDLGSFKAYISANRPLLLIRTKDQAYMIAPDDAHAMKQAIDQGKVK
jgi:hypothetical protein